MKFMNFMNFMKIMKSVNPCERYEFFKFYENMKLDEFFEKLINGGHESLSRRFPTT